MLLRRWQPTRYVDIGRQCFSQPSIQNALYVDGTIGSDSYTKAQAASPLTPWATIGRAVWGSTSRSSPNTAQAAAAGDTVLVRHGTYWAAPQCANSFDVWWNPANAGSVGSPITIRAEGVVHLASTGPRACGPLIGSFGRDYITWEGFTIDEDAAPPCGDTGAISVSARGCHIVGCVVRGSGWARSSAKTGGGGVYHELTLPVTLTSSTAATPTVVTATAHGLTDGTAIRVSGHSDAAVNGEWFVDSLTADTFALYHDIGLTNPVTGLSGTGGLAFPLRLDNHSPIFASLAHELRVSDCHLSRAHGYGENTSGIILYSSWGTIIEHCEFDDFEGYGVFYKGMLPEQVANADLYGPTIFRYNYVHNTNQGGVFQGDLPCTDSNRLLVYGNLFKSVGLGRGFQCLGLTDAARAPRHAWVLNNIFDDLQAGIALRFVADAAAGFTSQGNIIINCGNAYEFWPNGALIAGRWDIEHDVVYGNTTVMAVDPEGTNDTYATVSSLQSAYPHIGSATPSIATTDPLFVASATGDYRLQGGSPAIDRALSTNGLWGADGTVIDAGVHPITENTIGRTTYELPADRMTLWQPGVTHNGGIPTTRPTYTTLTPTGNDTAQIQAAINACPVGQVVELSAGTFTLASSTWITVKSGVTVRGQGQGVTIITPHADNRAIRKWPDAYVVPAGGVPIFMVADNQFLHWRAVSDAAALQVDAPKGAYGIRVDPAVDLTSKGIVVGAHVVLDEDHFYTGQWVDLPLSNGAANPWQVWQSDRVTWARYRRYQGPQSVVSSDASTNRFTCAVHPFQAGDGIYLTAAHSATLSPAYTDGRYYVASGAGDDPDTNTFKLRIWGGANHGVLVDITTGGSGGTAEAYMLYTDFDPGPASTIAAYGVSGEAPGNSLGWFGRGGGRSLGEVKKIRAITGNYIEFDTPLHTDYRVSHVAQICAADAPLVSDVGIESMTLRGGSDTAIQYQYAARCWAKDLEIDEWLGHAIELKMCYRCEITGCYIHDAAWPVPGGAGYGPTFSFHSAECLLEDTIIIGANKLMAGNAGGTACVVASCYLTDSQIWNRPQGVGSGTWSEAGGNIAHYNAPHHALITDCDAANYDSDITHGSSVYHTHYRNRARGYRRNKVEFAGNNNRRCMGLGAGTRWMSFVGNVLGESGQMTGFVYEIGAGVSFNSQPPSAWKLQYSVADWNQYRWEAAMATTLRTENYDFVQVQRNDTTRAQLPASLYTYAKPAYYGAAAWPPVDPLTGACTAIPALTRYNALHPGKYQWDNFNTPDGAIDGDWTVLQGGWNTATNRVVPTNAGHNAVYHSYDTMGANHYAQVRIVTAGDAGPAVRMGTGPSYYYASLNGTNCLIKKCVNGTHSTLATYVGITAGQIARLEVSGTTLTLKYDGSVVGSTSDGSIASGAGGMYSNGTTPVFDDFAWGEL